MPRATVRPVLRLLPREWSLAGAVVTGTVLRIDQIAIQIPLDDEWHALHAVQRFGYGHVATHFGWTDFCIPLTLLYKLAADTVGLSELWLRLPVLAAGMASLAALPLLARPWIGRDASGMFAWLLAVSPVHVYLSRYARPYSVALLLATLAVLAFPRVAGSDARRWRFAYAVGAIFAPYFHLTTAAVVLLPLGLAWTARLSGSSSRLIPATRILLGVSAAVAAGWALALGPPLLVDHAALSYKAGRSTLEVGTLVRAAHLAAGSARTEVVAALAAAVVLGGAALARRQPAVTAYVAVVGGFAALLPVLMRPALGEYPIVLVRYGLTALPLALAGAAAGFSRVLERAPAPARSLAGPALGAALFVLGPIPGIHYRPNAWTNHPAFQYEYAAPACDPQGSVPPFYRRLSGWPAGRETLVEAPWVFGAAGIRYHCYQQVHRQHMLIGFVAGPWHGPSGTPLPRPGELPLAAGAGRFAFRSFVHVGDREGLRRRRVRFVVFHKAIAAEMAGDLAEPQLGIKGWIARYRESYGPPVYEDDLTAVFDVAREANTAEARRVIGSEG